MPLCHTHVSAWHPWGIEKWKLAQSMAFWESRDLYLLSPICVTLSSWCLLLSRRVKEASGFVGLWVKKATWNGGKEHTQHLKPDQPGFTFGLGIFHLGQVPDPARLPTSPLELGAGILYKVRGGWNQDIELSKVPATIPESCKPLPCSWKASYLT